MTSKLNLRRNSLLVIVLSLIFSISSLGLQPSVAIASDPCSPKDGVLEENGQYFAIRYFLESCTWQVPAGVTSVDVLAVGGGGGGGADGGGGGGGGGGAIVSGLPVSGNVDITVGLGGLGGAYGDPSYVTKLGASGGDSSISTTTDSVTAPGGVGGNGCNFLGPGYCKIGDAGNNGGSSGAGEVAHGNLSGGNGGNGVWFEFNIAPTNGINGFQSNFDGITKYFGGGGGGSGADAQPGSGGAGGGATGITGSGIPSPATANTGGGGAGGNGQAGSAGGSGIVIVKYLIPSNSNPFVVKVSSPMPNGSYSTDQSIAIRVKFNRPVAVDGTPELEVQLDSGTAIARYVSGSETNEVTFQYEVHQGDATSSLEYSSVTSLSPNDGGIVNFGGAAAHALLDLPTPGYVGSLSVNSDIAIHTSVVSRPRLEKLYESSPDGSVVKRFLIRQQDDQGNSQTALTADYLCSINFGEFDLCSTLLTLERAPSYPCMDSGLPDFGDPGSCDVDNNAFIFEVRLPDNSEFNLQVVAIDAYTYRSAASNHIHFVTDSIGPVLTWRRPVSDLTATSTRLQPNWSASDLNGLASSGIAIRQVSTISDGSCNSIWRSEGQQTSNEIFTATPNHCYRWTLDPAISTDAIPPTDIYGNESSQNLTSSVIKVSAGTSEEQVETPRESGPSTNVDTKPLQSMTIPSTVKKKKSITVPAKSAQGIQTYVVASGACKAKSTAKTIKAKVGKKTVKTKLIVSYKITAAKAPGVCSIQTYNNGDATYATFNKTTLVTVTP